MAGYPMMTPVVFFVFIVIIIGGVVTWDKLKSKIWELQEENKDLKSRIDYLEEKTGYSLIVFKKKEWLDKQIRITIKKKFMEKAKKIFPDEEYSDLWGSLADFTGKGDSLKENYSISIYDKEFDDLFDDSEGLEKKFRERYPDKEFGDLFDSLR